MITSERRLYIQKKLEENNIVYLNDLAKELNTSICTIRRDFDYLEEQKFCKRVRGGAVKIKDSGLLLESMEMNDRLYINPDEKRMLCKKCAELVQDNECIFIDGGTTFMDLCQFLEGKRVTVATHNDFIRTVSENSTISLTKIGGEYSPRFRMNLGSIAIKDLQYFHFDKAFIGCAGIGIDPFEAYTSEMATAMIKEEVIKRSKKTYIVADAGKIGVYGFYKFAGENEIDALITDFDSADKINSIEVIKPDND